MSYLPEGGAYKEESRRGEPSRSAPSLFLSSTYKCNFLGADNKQ